MKNKPLLLAISTFVLLLSTTIIFTSFSPTDSVLPKEVKLYFTDTVPLLDPNEDVFMLVQESPRFPGCEDLESKDEKEDCAQKKMLEHIYGNLQYPALARENKVEGQVVLQFVVTKEGYIADIHVIRDLDDGCGEEALKVVQSMNDLPERWTPGKQRGNPVNVKYTLPVRFKLD